VRNSFVGGIKWRERDENENYSSAKIPFIANFLITLLFAQNYNVKVISLNGR
jgi:hypothetical protein